MRISSQNSDPHAAMSGARVFSHPCAIPEKYTMKLRPGLRGNGKTFPSDLNPHKQEGHNQDQSRDRLLAFVRSLARKCAEDDYRHANSGPSSRKAVVAKK